jgi:cytochrome c oxidase subunit IV
MYAYGIESNVQLKTNLTLILGYVMSVFGMLLAVFSKNKWLEKTFLYASFIRTALEASLDVLMLGLQELYYFPGWRFIH